jgi:DNA-binding response OmpR family regulator
MRIAVLDDDSAQADLVCQTLSAAGHVCHAYGAGRELVRQLRRQTFDLLVLDWNVPDMSGEEVLRWVRESLSERLPVLFMTSRGRETDITSILNIGADDYLVKPVSAAVLLARVGSLLRRAYYLKPPATKEVFGDFEFDLSAKHVVVRGTPVSVTHILDVIWKQATDIPSRTMDTHVSMLRSKLGLRPEQGYRLTPIYGYGYRLERIESGTPPAADDEPTEEAGEA